jgi:hypothetical protein
VRAPTTTATSGWATSTWWAPACTVAGTALLPFSPAQGNAVPAIAFVLVLLPPAAAGRRLIGRARLTPR